MIFLNNYCGGVAEANDPSWEFRLQTLLPIVHSNRTIDSDTRCTSASGVRGSPLHKYNCTIIIIIIITIDTIRATADAEVRTDGNEGNGLP